MALQTKSDYIKLKTLTMTNKDLKKLESLHSVLTSVLLDRVKSPAAKAVDLNVAWQFLKDNGIECIPTENNGMEDLMKNLPDLETIPVAEL